MVIERQPKHIIVSTDFALGDDYGAVLAMCAYASVHKNTKFSFIGTYGDRSAKEATMNLATQLPHIWRQLGQEADSCPDVYYGANKPTNSQEEFTIGQNAVERQIHGEFHHRDNIETLIVKPNTDNLYKTLSEGNIPVALLSIGAPTEALKATQELGSLVQYSVAMLGTGGLQGNVNPHREANASRDPQANIELLKASEANHIPLTLVQLDSTEQPNVLINEKTLQHLEKQLGQGSFITEAIRSISDKHSVYGKFYLEQSARRSLNFPYAEERYDKVPLHDLTAAMVLIDLLEDSDKKMFQYAYQIPTSFSPNGDGGASGRIYFPDTSYKVNIAGPIETSYTDKVLRKFGAPLTEKYWKELIKLMSLYH